MTYYDKYRAIIEPAPEVIVNPPVLGVHLMPSVYRGFKYQPVNNPTSFPADIEPIQGDWLIAVSGINMNKP